MKAYWRLTSTGAIVIALAISFGVIASATPNQSAQTSARNWSSATGDSGNTRFSSLSQINTDNVKTLGAGWISDKFDDAASSHATPVVDDGVMFITAGAKVYALDAKTGKTVWKVATATGAAAVGRGMGSAIPNPQGVVVAEGKVFVGFSNAQMSALDEKTGATIWHVSVGNVAPFMRGSVSSSPVYANGVIYTSLAFGDGRYIGRAIALDAKDGHMLWSWNTIPGPGEPGHETWAQDNDVWKMGGADIWLPPVVDTDLSLVYYGTGNTSPNRARGDLRPGNNLYTGCVIALDIKTGKLRWYKQLIHHDMWEGDVATPLILYDADVNGKTQKALAAIRPDGTLFLLDRATGKPIWPVEERPVRQSKLDKTSPTQPFPVGRGSLIERDCSQWKPIPGFIERCEFFEPVLEQPPNVLSYGPSTRSSPMSYDSQTGYFYIQGTDRMDWAWSSPDPSTWDNNYDYLTARVPNLYKQSVLIFAAVDPKTYKVVWKKQMRAAPNHYGVGGWLTTAGGLGFHRLEDGNLVAYDAKTGDELWKYQTGFAATDISTPMSYEVDGQQYISVLEGSQVFAFRLGGTIPQRPAPKLDPWDDIFRGPIQDSQIIQPSVPDRFNYRHDISPLKARVKVGSEVTFNNTGAETHTFVADDGSWTTGPIQPRETAVVTFDKPGTYLYHCKEHPWSYGLIIAVGDNPSANANAGAGGGTQ